MLEGRLEIRLEIEYNEQRRSSLMGKGGITDIARRKEGLY